MSTPQYPGYGQDPFAQQPQNPSAPWPEQPAQPYGQQPYPGAVPPAQPYPYGQPAPQEPVPGYAPQGYPQPPQGYPQQPYSQEPAPGYAQRPYPQEPAPQPYAIPDPAAAGHYGQPYQPYAAPAPQAPLPGTPAAHGKRVAAYLIDMAIAAGAAIVLAIIATVLAFTVDYTVGLVVFGVMYVALIAWFFVYSWMQGTNGSIGARAQRIRIASLQTGAPIGFGKAILRNLVLSVTSSVFGLGLFSILFDKSGRNQGWHDKAVGAIVLDGRTERPEAARRDVAPQAAPAAPEAPGWPAPSVDPYAAAPAADPYAPAPAADPYAPAPAADPYAPAPSAGPYPPAPAADPYPAAPAADPFAAPAQPASPPHEAPAAAAAAPAPVDPFATIVPPPFSGPITASQPAADPAPAPVGSDAVISFVPGITEERPAVPPLPEGELPDDTVIVQRRPEVKRAVLVWDDDIRHVVSLRTVFGRNPGQIDGAESIAVRDATLSLSKTHFEIDVDEHGAWVIDRHSTNGVEIVRGGQRVKAVAGERTPLEPGDTLQMGDREVTIEAIA